MRLRNLDLNLLLVFDAVMRERSAVRAASALALSQPAVSHALNRLRHALKDRLFVRTPSGMLPTPRAEALALPIRKALNELQLAVEGDQFDPAQANRRFTIAVNNYAAVVAVGLILAAARAQAPKVRLTLLPSGTLNLADRLDRGELDLAISSRALESERFASQRLIEDRFVAVLRAGHPALRKKLTAELLAGLPHLAITSSGENLDFVDAWLQARNAERTIAADVPYLSAGAVLVQSNMVAILGRKLALEFRRAYPIEMRELPFDAAKLQSVMSWHRRFDDMPAHRWLRDTIVAATAGI
ncbi:LysR family transcriptional regulator [Bradyrhizobium septentrionale]|uniref:LysR family transcriptional regulator n=1 Tax=Bradyrhizobium septentrionale TaxID=1404411 RepID=A0A973ZX60_9BRAD|nr:LysR family transcriptional regulator [Bradyrhizobium septentrionale]UGY19466.1 LysR family transcriptional regulator [Bradyrhizobium septentrionale]UGY28235.1 LysR family transcriptional regulator [Bradyrhizobium septentrionale]